MNLSSAVATDEIGARRRALIWTVLASFCFWTALGVFFAAQLHFAGMPWPQALDWSLPRWYTWGLLTPGIFWLDRRLIDAWPLLARLAIHVPLSLVWTAVAILLRLLTRPLRGAPVPDDVAAFFALRFAPDIAIYFAIAGVSLLRAYTARIRQREREATDRAVNLERRLAEAHLQGLRGQLQPHFLFNALNTISAFTESDPRQARRLMEQLGHLLRASLTHTSRPLATLGEELTFLDDYLAIESARFEGRINISVKADDDLVAALVPSFLLQPLVENAIRHGVAPRLSGGRIAVRVERADSSVVISVEDDGVGLPQGWDLDRQTGVGLSNLRARLTQLYGPAASLEVSSVATGGVTVRVKLPLNVPVAQP